MFTPLLPRFHVLLSLTAIPLFLASACGGGSGTGTGGEGTTTSNSTTSATGTGGTGTTGSTSSTSGTTGTGGELPVCPPGQGYGGGETPTLISSLNATVQDTMGSPVANQPVFICGLDLCTLPQNTNAAGVAAVSNSDMMKKPAFKFGDALNYVRLAIPLTMADSTLGTVVTGKLPAAGAALAAGSDATSGDVKLSIAAGAAVVVNELAYDTPDKAQFRSVQIPVDKAQMALASAALPANEPAFELLYGVAPTETTLCPAAKVTVTLPAAVKASLTPNTAVEFWIMNVETGQEHAPYAGWAKASDGVVSADGNTVSTVDGGGFVYLETFAIRKKP